MLGAPAAFAAEGAFEVEEGFLSVGLDKLDYVREEEGGIDLVYKPPGVYERLKNYDKLMIDQPEIWIDNVVTFSPLPAARHQPNRGIDLRPGAIPVRNDRRTRFGTGDHRAHPQAKYAAARHPGRQRIDGRGDDKGRCRNTDRLFMIASK